MRTEGLPRYLMLDFNAYFASVEQQVRPELRGRPVAVVPIEGTDSTCAIAASYEAKRMGVKTAMRIFEARKVCPGLVCVPARHDLYVEYHERLMAEVANHLPIHKIGSIDECSCRLIGSEREPANAKKIALGMKAGIHAKVGEHLHCSIGIAPTLLLAKIATKMQKPDGLVVLEEHELPGPLLKMQLTDLPGIALNMEARLNRAGVMSIADLWHLEPKEARLVWGSVGGERFWYELHGVDIQSTTGDRRSIGHSRVLSPQMRPPDRARIVARALLLKAATRLRRYGLAAGALGVSARAEWRSRYVAETTLAPTQDSFVLLARARPHVVAPVRGARSARAPEEGFDLDAPPGAGGGAGGRSVHRPAARRPHPRRGAVARHRQARRQVPGRHRRARLAARALAAISRRQDRLHAGAGRGGVPGVRGLSFRSRA